MRSLAVNVCLAYLKAEGTRVVFGIPGGLLHPFFAAVEKDPELRLVVTKHEEGGGAPAGGEAPHHPGGGRGGRR